MADNQYDLSAFDQGVEAHKQANQYDFSHFDNAANPSASQQTPGMLESLARGAEQGATLDFAPRINAALESAVKGTDYDQSLKEALTRFQAARAAHPYAYGAGNLAGFTVPTLATGGENLVGEGLAGAAKAGAGYGALSGIGQSQDLTNLSDVAKNAAIGGGLGVAGGVLGSAAADVGGAVLGGIKGLGSDAAEGIASLSPTKKFSTGFGTGVTSGMVAGEQAGTQAIKEVSDALTNAQNTYTGILRNAASKAENLRMGGDVIDHSDWFDAAQGAIDHAKNYIPEADTTTQSALDKLGNLINGYRESWGDTLTPTQSIILKRKLGQLGSEGDKELNDVYARQLANRLISPANRGLGELESTFNLPQDFTPLKDVLNQGIEGLPEQNQIMHKMLASQEDFPDMGTLLNAQKGGRAGVEAQQKLSDFYDNLPESVVAAIKPSLDQAAQKAGVAEAINASSLGTGILGTGIAKGAIYAAGNVTGAAARSIGRAASATGEDLANGNIGSLFKTMYNQSPQTFNTIGNQLASVPGALGEVGKALLGAAGKDNYGRNAIIFALQQNPAYRQATEDYFGINTPYQETTKTSQLEHINQ